MRQFWRDHSLTIVLTVVGLAFLGIAIPFREGTTFDVVVGFGHGTLTVALFNFLAIRFREIAKPEDEPRKRSD